MIKATRFFLLLGCISLFFACSKKSPIEVDNETQSAIDYSIADHEFMSVVPAVFQSALQTAGAANTETMVSLCDTLTFIGGDTSDFIPNTIYSLNLSQTTCSALKSDGKNRSGIITIRLTGKMNVVGSQAIIHLTNYNSNGIKYACDSIVLKLNAVSLNKADFEVKLINGTCKTSANTIKFEFERTVTIYPKGESGKSVGATYFYGNAWGTNSQGIKFSTNVTPENSLIKHSNCMFIERGLMELTPEGYKTREINFGDGNCDNEATFTVKENTVAFKLK
jgi:hypothetical protein